MRIPLIPYYCNVANDALLYYTTHNSQLTVDSPRGALFEVSSVSPGKVTKDSVHYRGNIRASQWGVDIFR